MGSLSLLTCYDLVYRESHYKNINNDDDDNKTKFFLFSFYFLHQTNYISKFESTKSFSTYIQHTHIWSYVYNWFGFRLTKKKYLNDFINSFIKLLTEKYHYNQKKRMASIVHHYYSFVLICSGKMYIILSRKAL